MQCDPFALLCDPLLHFILLYTTLIHKGRAYIHSPTTHISSDFLIGGGGYIPARMLRTELKIPILAITLELYDDRTNTANTEVKKVTYMFRISYLQFIKVTYNFVILHIYLDELPHELVFFSIFPHS